ncbi:MAG: AAA family ATPase [Candidatus Hydrogenedens sp.]|nr:AAA family ATPase [Candidatus Hydrogenedens sp.]
MTAEHYTPAAGLFDAWADDVLHGKPPELWTPGAGFHSVELGPGLVVLVGGAPGAGKTALAMQWTVDALRADESLRVLVSNVEMAPRTLLDRQLARLAGVDASWIRKRMLAGQEYRVRAGLDELRRVSERLAFHTGPPVLADVARSVDAFGARFLVADYVQRFTIGNGDALDRRAELDGIMGHFRRFADAGLGVLAVSAVARQKGRTGSNYAGLGLASFRGSSELEYGADSCWTLSKDDAPDQWGAVNLTCQKNRHGETPSLLLTFDAARQTFTVANTGGGTAGAVTVPGRVSAVPDAFDLGGTPYNEADGEDGLF